MAEDSILLSRAKSAVIARDFSSAARFYKQYLHDNPNDIKTLRALGELYMKSSNDENALKIFRKICELNPRDTDCLITIGGICRRLKKYDDSLDALKKARAIGANSSQLAYNLGFTYKDIGKTDEAIQCFEEAVTLNPNDVLAYNHVGVIFASRGEHKKAISFYSRGLKVDKNHPILRLNAAKSFESLGDYERAILYYESALRSKPGWSEAVEGFSRLLLKLNRVRQACDVVGAALKVNPDEPQIHSAMGDLYVRQSVFDDAEKEYKIALEHDARFEPALLGLSLSQEEAGKTKEALETVKKLETLSADDEKVLRRGAHVYLSADYLSAAYENLKKLLKKDSGNPESLDLLAQYYICDGKNDKAEQCFRRIDAIDPQYKDYLREGAKRFKQKGNIDAAEKFLQKAVEFNPNDTASKLLLASIYEKNGCYDNALKLFHEVALANENNRFARNAIRHLEEKTRESNSDALSGELNDLAETNALSGFADDFDFQAGEEISLTNENAFEEFENAAFNFNNEETESASDNESEDEDKSEEDDDFDSARFAMENLAQEDKTLNVFDAAKNLLLDTQRQDENRKLGGLIDTDSPLDAEPFFPQQKIPDGSQQENEDKNQPKDSVSFGTLRAEDIIYSGEIIHVTDAASAAEPKNNLIDLAKNPDSAKLISQTDLTDADFTSDFDTPPENTAPTEANTQPTDNNLPQKVAPSADVPSDNNLPQESEAAAEDNPQSADTAAPARVKITDTLDLFKALRSLVDFIPPARKSEFLGGRKRLLLDYVISKLSGNPGLFAAAGTLNDSDKAERDSRSTHSQETPSSKPAQPPQATSEGDQDAEDFDFLSKAAEIADNDDSIDDLAKTVLSDLRKLIDSVEDDSLKKAMTDAISDVSN